MFCIFTEIMKESIYQCGMCKTTTPSKFYVYNHFRCKECSSNAAKANYKKLSRKAKIIKNEKYIEWQEKNLIKYRLGSLRRAAKTRNLEFNITEEDIQEQFILQEGKCFYSGINLNIKDIGEFCSFSVDRIDNELGYTKENIVLTIAKINTMKSDLTLVDFQYLIKRLAERII